MDEAANDCFGRGQIRLNLFPNLFPSAGRPGLAGG
jgi:hypothetical protein